MFGKQLCREIKESIRKAKYQVCLQRIEKFIQKQSMSFNEYSPSFIIDVLFLQNYCCHKIGNKCFSGVKETIQLRIIVPLILIMQRNVSLMHAIFLEYIQINQNLVLIQKQQIQQHLFHQKGLFSIEGQHQLLIKHFNKFSQAFLFMVRNLVFYYEVRNHNNQKSKVLNQAISFIGHTDRFYDIFPYKNKNQKNLETQILCLYAVHHLRQSKFFSSKTIFQSLIKKIQYSLNMLDKKYKQSIETKGENKRRKRNTNQEGLMKGKSEKILGKQRQRRIRYFENMIKKQNNKLFLVVLYLSIDHICLGHIYPLKYLFEMVKKCQQNIPCIKKMTKLLISYGYLREQLQNQVKIQQQLIVLLNYVGISKYKIQMMIKDEKCEQHAKQKKYVNRDKKDCLGLVYDTYNKIVEKEQISEEDKQIIKKPSNTNHRTLLFKNTLDFDQSLRIQIDILNKNDHKFVNRKSSAKKSKNSFSSTFSDSKRISNSHFYFNRKKISQSSHRNSQLRYSVKVNKYSDENIDKRKQQLFNRAHETKLKERLMRQGSDEGIEESRKQNNYLGIFNQNDGIIKCGTSKSQYKRQNTKSKKYSGMTMRSDWFEENGCRKSAKNSINNLKKNQQKNKIQKFYRLLIQNKKYLSISEFSCKVQTHLKKLQLRKITSNSAHNKQFISDEPGFKKNKHMYSSANIDGVFSKTYLKQKQPVRSVKMIKYKSLNINKQLIDSSLAKKSKQKTHNPLKKVTYHQNLNKNKNFDEDIMLLRDSFSGLFIELQKNEQDKKKETCYKKSFETVNELLRKLQEKRPAKKLIRKSTQIFACSNK